MTILFPTNHIFVSVGIRRNYFFHLLLRFSQYVCSFDLTFWFPEMLNLTTSLCWKLVKKEGYIAIWQKPLNNNCYLSREAGTKPPLCDESDDPDNVWYSRSIFLFSFDCETRTYLAKALNKLMKAIFNLCCETCIKNSTSFSLVWLIIPSLPSTWSMILCAENHTFYASYCLVPTSMSHTVVFML